MGVTPPHPYGGEVKVPLGLCLAKPQPNWARLDPASKVPTFGIWDATGSGEGTLQWGLQGWGQSRARRLKLRPQRAATRWYLALGAPPGHQGSPGYCAQTRAGLAQPVPAPQGSAWEAPHSWGEGTRPWTLYVLGTPGIAKTSREGWLARPEPNKNKRCGPTRRQPARAGCLAMW